MEPEWVMDVITAALAGISCRLWQLIVELRDRVNVLEKQKCPLSLINHPEEWAAAQPEDIETDNPLLKHLKPTLDCTKFRDKMHDQGIGIVQIERFLDVSGIPTNPSLREKWNGTTEARVLVDSVLPSLRLGGEYTFMHFVKISKSRIASRNDWEWGAVITGPGLPQTRECEDCKLVRRENDKWIEGW